MRKIDWYFGIPQLNFKKISKGREKKYLNFTKEKRFFLYFFVNRPSPTQTPKLKISAEIIGTPTPISSLNQNTEKS